MYFLSRKASLLALFATHQLFSLAAAVRLQNTAQISPPPDSQQPTYSHYYAQLNETGAPTAEFINSNSETIQTPVIKHYLSQINENFDGFIKSFSQLQQSENNTASQEEGNMDDLQLMAVAVESFVTQRAVLVFVLAFMSVIICCLVSQCIVKFSKNKRLELNKYYNKKRYEKAKMIQAYLYQKEEEEIAQNQEGYYPEIPQNSESPFEVYKNHQSSATTSHEVRGDDHDYNLSPNAMKNYDNEEQTEMLQKEASQYSSSNITMSNQPNNSKQTPTQSQQQRQRPVIRMK